MMIGGIVSASSDLLDHSTLLVGLRESLCGCRLRISDGLRQTVQAPLQGRSQVRRC
jgi:hypothetical protein